MFSGKDVSAIYLDQEEVRNLKHDLAKLVAKAQIQSIRDLVLEYRSVSDLQTVLRDLTYVPEEDT